MSDHLSDCALHNAPAAAPQPCTCGASFRFRLFEYDVTYDVFRWRKMCRETLVAEIASRALAKAYGEQKVVRTSTLISRAVHSGFTPNERAAIQEAWAAVWAPRTPDYLERQGIDDFVSGENGAYLTAAERAPLSVHPTLEEITEVIAPWLDYWATLPEPTGKVADFAI